MVGKIINKKGTKKTFWVDGNVLYLVQRGITRENTIFGRTLKKSVFSTLQSELALLFALANKMR